MTYLQFHLVFMLPPLFVLGVLSAPHLARYPRVLLAIVTMAVVALVYTTPWDNYLIWKGVWRYGTDRVLGIIGYVPVEEYAFFLLQPLLTGLWYILMVSHVNSPPDAHAPHIARWIGTGICILSSILGGAFLLYERTTYMGLILFWGAPILALQWGWVGHVFWRLRRRWLIGTLVPTVYLWLADRIAIEQGIWSIAERFTVGLHIFGLPLEEAIFFLVTNILVVQGLIMLIEAPDLTHRVA